VSFLYIYYIIFLYIDFMKNLSEKLLKSKNIIIKKC